MRAGAAALLHPARAARRRPPISISPAPSAGAPSAYGRARDKPDENVTPEVLKYVNRLSDFLFVAGRFVNDKGARDVLWVPGQNR